MFDSFSFVKMIFFGGEGGGENFADFEVLSF